MIPQKTLTLNGFLDSKGCHCAVCFETYDANNSKKKPTQQIPLTQDSNLALIKETPFKEWISSLVNSLVNSFLNPMGVGFPCKDSLPIVLQNAIINRSG